MAALTSPWSRAALQGAVVAAATPVAMVVARRAGMVDHPGPLKPQQRPVPYLGGAAVGCGLVAGGVGRGDLRWTVPPLAAMALGLTDDVRDLSASTRLIAEVGIGALVGVTRPGSSLPVAAAGGAFTVVMVNAVNLIDGLDGLAGGVSGVSAVGFAVLLDGADRLRAAGLAGALAGFLVYNRAPARIYLGDAGSYLVGTALSQLLVAAWSPPKTASRSLACLALVGFPVAELACSIVRRRRGRRPLTVGDREHSYDRLVAAGWSPGRASLACMGAQAVLALVAVAAGRRSPKGARR